jgi:hypothetical protein
VLSLLLACVEPAKVDSSNPAPLESLPTLDSPAESEPARDSDSEPRDSPRDSQPTWIDEDGDGFEAEADCDDQDASIHPGAPEVCGDGVDQDCDGADAGYRSGTVKTGEAELLVYGGDYDRLGNSAAVVQGLAGTGTLRALVGAYADGNGSVLLLDGSEVGELSASSVSRVVGASDDSAFGRDISSAGDADDDGSVDLLVGALWTEGRAGRVTLVRGPLSLGYAVTEADTSWLGEAEDDFLGTGVSGGGDVNGDGLDDLLLGAAGADTSELQAGRAYLLLGPNDHGRPLSEADAVVEGVESAGYVGYDLGLGSDINEDGYHDLAIGAPYADEEGRLYVFLGPVSGTQLATEADTIVRGDGQNANLGWAVRTPGDLNRDGVGDLLVGAPGTWGTQRGQGAVGVLYGPLSGGSHSLDGLGHRLVGEKKDGSAGHAMDVVGDVDGDGWLDLLVGAPTAYQGGIAGQAALFHGPITADRGFADAALLIEGEGSDQVGSAVSGGDLDSDGSVELVLGAYTNGLGGVQAGGVYVLSTCASD